MTSGGYSATYDAAGDMTCRAPASGATCTGSSPTGAGLSYDNEGQLTGWTSALTGQPTPSRDTFAYDGEGARVAQQASSPTGIMTTTDYLLGGLEEQQTVGGSVRPSTTLTEYYPLPGIGTAVRVTTSSSSTLSYLAGDQLGSVSVALSTSGTVTAQALYSPYGTVRYSSGSMPTAHGYTGQLADGMTGLDYYGARYYDPALGQFAQADSVLDGLNRYAYVGGNPTTATDPTGSRAAQSDTEAELGDLGPVNPSGGVPSAYTQAFANSPDDILDPDSITITSPDGATTTTYTLTGDGEIEVIVVDGSGVGTVYTTTWLNPNSSGYNSAYNAIFDVSLPPAAKIKSAYIPKGSSGQTSGSTGGSSGSGGSGSGTAPTSAPPATGSSGANGGAGTTPPTGSCGCWPDESGGGDEGITWQTYIVTNSETGEVYSGRTSGSGTPEENIRRRFRAGHSKVGNGWGEPELDQSSSNYPAIRGREQMLIDYFRSQGIATEQYNGVSPRNAHYNEYIQAALDEFGPITSDPRC